MSLRPGSSSQSSETRTNSYKSGIDADMSRRRREKELVTVRKNKREHTLFKKRTQTQDSTSHHDNSNNNLEAIPSMVKLLQSSNNHDDIEQSALALGNIASHSIIFRDFVLDQDALAPLLSHLNTNSRLSMLKIGSWTLFNLVRGLPPPDFEKVKHVFSVLWFLIQSDDEEVLTNACLALSYLSADGSIQRIQAIVEAGFCSKLVSLLVHQSDTVIEPVLLTLASIIANSGVAVVQLLIDTGLLQGVLTILMYKRVKGIIEEACWVISNIITSDTTHIAAVIDAKIISILISILNDAAEFDIKKEALGAIVDVTCLGSHEQIRFLVAEGCIKPLCDLLICSDPTLVSFCLNGLETILLAGEAEKEMGWFGANVYACRVDECGGKDKIENLLTHANNYVSDRAVRIVERFWADDDMEEDVNPKHPAICHIGSF